VGQAKRELQFSFKNVSMAEKNAAKMPGEYIGFETTSANDSEYFTPKKLSYFQMQN